MNLQELIDKAKIFKRKGNLKEALRYYNDAFNFLVSEANEFAHDQEKTFVDKRKMRTILPKHFKKAKDYLKRDKTAAIISNNMGVIFAELNDFKSASKFFNQAVDLTPDGESYQDPKINLKELER